VVPVRLFTHRKMSTINDFNQLCAERLQDLEINGPNVWSGTVGRKRYWYIAVMMYGKPSYVPFSRSTTFSIQRTNSEIMRTRLLLNYPHYAPADDGFTYYISADTKKRFQPPLIIYVNKTDARILEEKFKNM